MFCCVASFSPACSDRKYRSRRSRNWAIKTPGKAERDTRLQWNAGAGNKGACWMEFRSFNQDGNRLDMPSLAVFPTVQTVQFVVSNDRLSRHKPAKKRSKKSDSDWRTQLGKDWATSNRETEELEKLERYWQKNLRHTFTCLRKDFSNESSAGHRCFLLWFRRVQLRWSQIGKGPTTISRIGRPVCLSGKIKQLSSSCSCAWSYAKSKQGESEWQLSASANCSSFDCWNKLNPKVF